jgi:hypothetical protein
MLFLFECSVREGSLLVAEMATSSTTNLVTVFLGFTSELSNQSGARESFRCSLFRASLKMRVHSRIARHSSNFVFGVSGRFAESKARKKNFEK